MAGRINEVIEKEISERLGFYDDLGIRLFYKDRGASGCSGFRIADRRIFPLQPATKSITRTRHCPKTTRTAGISQSRFSPRRELLLRGNRTET